MTGSRQSPRAVGLPDAATRTVVRQGPRPAEHDRYLDAAARCFVRHGVAHTSVPDVAAELGVDRTTVYRRVGGVTALAAELLNRELERLLTDLYAAARQADGRDELVAVLVATVQRAREHPVLVKVLADEPAVVGQLLLPRLEEIVEWAAASLLEILPGPDPELPHRADALARLMITLVLAPGGTDPAALLRVVAGSIPAEHSRPLDRPHPRRSP